MRGIRVLRAVAAAGMLAALIVLIPGQASASVSGPCTATLAGIPVTAGHDTAGSAIHVDYRSSIPYDGRSTAGTNVTAVRVHVEVESLNVRTTDGKTNGPTWTSVAEVKKYAWAGVGLYRIRGEAFGAGAVPLCSGTAYVCVDGKSPFLTVAGIVGALLGAAALYLLIKGLAVRRSRSRAELGTRFGFGGFLGGLSAVVLLQQFCVIPLTQGLSGGAVVGGLVGMALVGAVIAGGRRTRMPLVVPPKRRDEPETAYRFEAPDDACTACRNHAEHRTYRSMEAAEADRAHPGCHCEIVTRPSQRAELVAHFSGGRDVFDDRG
jgi:hypothetical protein